MLYGAIVGWEGVDVGNASVSEGSMLAIVDAEHVECADMEVYRTTESDLCVYEAAFRRDIFGIDVFDGD